MAEGKCGKLSQHHCRNCGKSICSDCTAEDSVPLPQYALNTPQRVCLMCFKKLDKPDGESNESDRQQELLPAEYLRMFGQSPTPAPPSTTTTQEQEEDDLQLAIAMSLNEQENKKPSPRSSPAPSAQPRPVAASTVPETAPSAPSIYSTLNTELSAPGTATPAVVINTSGRNGERQDNELEHYLNRAHWERKAGSTHHVPTAGKQEQNDEAPVANPLVHNLASLLAQFMQRMHEVNRQGGGIATDRVVLSMHQNLTAMHVQLLKQIDEVQQKKALQERILHKLNEAKEARVTLDTMRRRHQDQLLQQQREQEALAQMQVQMKLALLRQQKAEQMAYGQSMQQERLGRLTTQRIEYERQLAAQRDQQRQLLIQQEEQVFQQQFGDGVTAPPISIHPPPSLAGAETQSYSIAAVSGMGQPPVSMHSYSTPDPSLSQALPLPSKAPIDYAPTPPPPYQPSLSGAPTALYHPSSMDPAMASYQPAYPATINPAPNIPSVPLQSIPPPSLPPPPVVAGPPYPPVQHAGPLPQTATPPSVHRQTSSSPLISFD